MKRYTDAEIKELRRLYWKATLSLLFPENKEPSKMNTFKFRTVVFIHHLLAIGLVLACICSFFLEPWYITVVVVTFVVRLMTSRERCILTDMESNLRKELGMIPLRKGFVNHYYRRD